MSRRRVGVALSAAFVVAASDARASDPLNSSDKPTNVARSGDARDTKKEGHDELNVVPVVGGSTDIGVGGGYFAGLAHVKQGYDPYVWNVESATMFTFAPRDGGGVLLPYQDAYVKLSVPRFLAPRLRLELRPSYTGETTVHYYGLGNASTVSPAGAPDKHFEYARFHPQVELDLRWAFADHLIGRIGGRFVRNWLWTTDDSKLVSDLRNGSPEEKKLLGDTRAHSVALFRYGVQWDDRDNEASPHAGGFHTLDVKLAPGGAGDFPYRYGQATAAARVFLPVWKPRVTLALRLVGDVLFGNPPFYELSRVDDTYAIGGGNGVRGVPSGRYYGKVKVFGNVEVRTELVSFHALGKPLVFGVTLFFDGGRVWADEKANPALDGTGLGLKYGTGGGLRLQSGSAFVLRADVAWSPDATPVGGYFSAGQAF